MPVLTTYQKLVVLTHAMQRLERRGTWARGNLALDKLGEGVEFYSPEAVKFCAVGSALRSYKEVINPDFEGSLYFIGDGGKHGFIETQLSEVLDRASQPDEMYVTSINDDSRYHKRDVLAVYRRAIAMLRELAVQEAMQHVTQGQIVSPVGELVGV